MVICEMEGNESELWCTLKFWVSKCIVPWQLKARLVEQEEEAIVRQKHGKNISAETNQHARVEELLEVVFSVQSVEALWQGPMGEVCQFESGVSC